MILTDPNGAEYLCYAFANEGYSKMGSYER